MKILFDSDILFALYVASDALHLKSKKDFQKYLAQKADFFITNLVLQETATVLSYKFGQRTALNFLKRVKNLGAKEIFVSQKATIKAWEIFQAQKKKGTSFIDCANIAVYQEFKLDKIFSFDKFYQKRH